MAAFADPTLFLETICPHAGGGLHDGEPLVAPLVPSTTFCRAGLDSRAEHQYSRVSNPTVAALEAALAELEGAAGAVAFGSGLAAETALFLTLLRAGDHVVCSRALYGGTRRLLEQVLAPLSISASFADTTDLAAVAAALGPRTKLVFVETPANPTLDVSDLSGLASLARAHGAQLAVDNTFLTALLQRPLDLGADVTVTSTTKFVEGHSVALGGAIVARDEALLERVRFVRKCTGGILSPFSAWLTLQGLKTLPLRLARQSATAAELARWLAAHPAVRTVHYPGLPGAAHPSLLAAQHLGAHGAVLSFEAEGGLERARELVDHLRLCRLVEHVGSVETLVTHSASMTHASLSREERLAVGVTDGLLRLSVGLEPASAVRADLERALAASAGAGERKEVTPCATLA